MGKQAGGSLASLARARLRKSRRQSDISKGIRALVVEDLRSPSPTPASPSTLATPARRDDRSRSPVHSPAHARGNSFPSTPPQSTASLLSAGSPIHPTHIPKSPSQTSIASSSWDIVEELPTRWATDFVQFASANSRLSNIQILFYHLHRSTSAREPTSLAIATKSSILLYESPRNERAFKFVKVSVAANTIGHKCLTLTLGILYATTSKAYLVRFTIRREEYRTRACSAVKQCKHLIRHITQEPECRLWDADLPLCSL